MSYAYYLETLASLDVYYLGENVDNKKIFSFGYDVFDNVVSNADNIVSKLDVPCIVLLDHLELMEPGIELISAFFMDFVSLDNPIFKDRLTETECKLFVEDMEIELDDYISSNKCHINVSCYGFRFELAITLSPAYEYEHEEY